MVDTVIIPNQLKPESPEYIAAMAAKGEAAVNGGVAPGSETTVETVRPDWLPEKFKSVEDMAKAYKELEGKLGTPPAADAAADPAAPVAPKTGDDNLQIDATATVEAKGFKMADLNTEYAANGSLSDETYTKLGDAGFSREDVDTYIEGRKALIRGIEDEGYKIVGDKDSYEAMKVWAKANLQPNEILAFNKAVADSTTRELAIQGMNAKFRAGVGNEPQTRLDGRPASGASDVYESRMQMQVDMNSKEYRTDPAFRAKVAAKLGRSDIF